MKQEEGMTQISQNACQAKIAVQTNFPLLLFIWLRKQIFVHALVQKQAVH